MTKTMTVQEYNRRVASISRQQEEIEREKEALVEEDRKSRDAHKVSRYAEEDANRAAMRDKAMRKVRAKALKRYTGTKEEFEGEWGNANKGLYRAILEQQALSAALEVLKDDSRQDNQRKAYL
jgi:hypothetical protein